MEKQPSDNVNTDGSVLESQPSDAVKNPSSGGVLARLNERIAAIRFMETRGIERVPESERHSATAADYMQMGLLWFSTNITANNIAVGMLGPLDYGLSFVDSALCATFGALLGAAGAAYMGTWGPVSGNRTMVSSFLLSRAINCLTMSGYCALFHGLLPQQNLRPSKHRHHVGLWND